jgi:hypothetical protein
LETITFEQIEKLLPNDTHLYEVGNESYTDFSKIQECITKQSFEPLCDVTDHWEPNTSCYKNELIKDMQREFDIDEKEAKSLYGTHVCEIQEHFYSHDKSDTVTDLVNNIPKLTLLYDTGYEMEGDSWRWNNKRTARECIKILKHLGYTQKAISKLDRNRNIIKKNRRGKEYREATIWGSIWDVVQNATYGGNLEIYFKADITDLLFADEDNQPSHIRFKNCCVGVVGHGNGSGYVAHDIEGIEVLLPWNPKNLFIDHKDVISYSWCNEIAGDSIKDYGTFEFLVLHHEETLTNSNLNAKIQRDLKLDKRFKEGGCTPGDMKYTRHRRVEYINNFPCGNKCMDCGTFWID